MEYTGTIYVGDQFVWQPRMPKAYARIEITDITQNEEGDVFIRSCKVNTSGEPLHEAQSDSINEEVFFRESVELWRICPNINELERLAQYSTDNPRQYVTS